jgi:hypothetical protein
MEHCCNKPDTCQWMCRRNPHFLSQLQEIGGFSLDNIQIDGPALAVAPLPPVVPLIYHGYRRAKPLVAPAAAIKLAQLYYRRTGVPRFSSREQLCRRFALLPSVTLVASGVDDDPYIEPWWGIGRPRRLAIIEAMKATGIALVTAPNFSLSVNWPRTGDMAAMKLIARVYEEFVGAGLPATLHTHGRTDTDFAHWARLLQRIEAIDRLSYEFTTGAAYGERRDRHIAWLKGLAGSVARPLHLVVYGDTTVVQELAPAFATVTLIETSSFFKAIHCQEPAQDERGRRAWRTRPTRRDADLSDFLQSAIAETAARIGQQNAGTSRR